MLSSPFDCLSLHLPSPSQYLFSPAPQHMSNARNNVPVEREIARNYRPLRQEVDHPGRRIGDHCCILDVRSSDGVQTVL